MKLFVGFEVGQPAAFYSPSDILFKDFEADDQGAVNLAKQMLPCYQHVDFIEFYDVDIANNFALAPIDGSTPTTLIQVTVYFGRSTMIPMALSLGASCTCRSRMPISA